MATSGGAGGGGAGEGWGGAGIIKENYGMLFADCGELVNQPACEAVHVCVRAWVRMHAHVRGRSKVLTGQMWVSERSGDTLDAGDDRVGWTRSITHTRARALAQPVTADGATSFL